MAPQLSRCVPIGQCRCSSPKLILNISSWLFAKFPLSNRSSFHYSVSIAPDCVTPFRRESLLVLLMILCALSTGCRSSKLTGVSKANLILPSGAYSLSLEEAKKNASKDELETIFNVKSRLSLSGQEIKSLSGLRVTQDGSILLLDNERRVAEAYTAAGAYMSPIGGSGNSPGNQVWPSDVIETRDNSIAVSDFQGHRVNMFSKDGQLKSSFVYTPQNFSAQRMIYDDINNWFFLFGNRWQTGSDGEISGADLLHKYSPDGQFVASYFPFPEKAKSLDLYTFNSPAMDIHDGVVYIALPFDYTVYRLDSTGNISALFKGENTSFKEPTTKLDTSKVAPQDSYRYVQDWRTSWTPILALVRVNDHLLVEYQTFDNLRYRIDVWSLATGKITKSIRTNHLMLTRGRDEHIYFLDNLENRGQAQYGILKATPKI